MDDLLPEFIAETREMLGAITSEIVAWEADPLDRARLDRIFRFVHTVKGSCGFLNLPRLERLSHVAEDALAELRDGRRIPDRETVGTILAIVDRISELVEAMESGESVPHDEDQLLIGRLTGDAAPSAPYRARASRASAHTVRVPVDLLDRMMTGLAEVMDARIALSGALSGTKGAAAEAFERLSDRIDALREAVARARMQRVESIFSTLPRLVRDLSGDLGKLVTLDVAGGDVELDRETIELIRDPIQHSVRNAIDHGIGKPEVRRAKGKSAAGRLAVGARAADGEILIEIVDDGGGIDGDGLASRAVAAGIVSADRAAAMSWAEKLSLTFEPGLSTADSVTAISGRGVGMDIVRANISRIGGSVHVESKRGIGTRLTLRVPLVRPATHEAPRLNEVIG